MGEVLSMANIRTGRKESIEWAEVRAKVVKGELIETPVKVWENLKCVLDKYNIKPRLNVVSHEIDYIGLETNEISRNSVLTDIYGLQLKEGLNLTRDENFNCIKRIAELNSYNPFTQILQVNENSEMHRLREVFECLELHENDQENAEFYFSLFLKWSINVVKMAHNTLQNDFSSQGVLVLQGGQGCFKSTFCRHLMTQKELYKGDKTLEPEKTDSVAQNTKYILVEWGELDHTMKAEQSKLKQFITATNDEYRAPYDRISEKYPRLTSYIGTVNKKDFLKDETGSRRFWIIPVKKCNIDKMQTLDIDKFWGTVYYVWKNKIMLDYLTPEEQQKLAELNSGFNFVSDISITVDEELMWDTPEELWEVHNISDLCAFLGIREKKALTNEMERRGIKYKNHKITGNRQKKGFRVPPIRRTY